MATTGDFYEDDEPVAEVVAAFESGTKGFTGKKAGWTDFFKTPWLWARTSEPSPTKGTSVHWSPAH